MRAERPAGCLCNPPQKAVARLGSRLLTSGRTTCRFWAALPVELRQPGHNYAPFFLPQLAAGKDRHTMAQLAARGTPRRHPTIWELYLPRVRQRVSLAEPARAKGARRIQISGAVCCIAGPGRTGACGCKTRVRHHGTESPVHKIAIDGRQRPPRPASGRVSPTLRVRCSALLCRAAIEFTRGWQCAEAVELRGFCGKI